MLCASLCKRRAQDGYDFVENADPRDRNSQPDLRRGRVCIDPIDHVPTYAIDLHSCVAFGLHGWG